MASRATSAALTRDLKQRGLLALLGYDHHQFTYTFQGVAQRLTNITKPFRVVSEIFT